MADHEHPGTYVEVTVERTVTQQKRVAVTVPEGGKTADAGEVALAKVNRQTDPDAGWTNSDTGAPQVKSCESKGPIVYRPRRFWGVVRMKSTGKPA